MNAKDENATKEGMNENAEEENVVENEKEESSEEPNLKSDCFPKENACTGFPNAVKFLECTRSVERKEDKVEVADGRQGLSEPRGIAVLTSNSLFPVPVVKKMELETLAASQKAEDEAPADVTARKASEEATAKKVALAAAGKAAREASPKTAATKAAEETTAKNAASGDMEGKEDSAKVKKAAEVMLEGKGSGIVLHNCCEL